MTVAKVHETRLVFRRQKEGVYAVEVAGMPDVDGITIDLKQDRVRTPVGTLGPSKVIENQDERAPTGPWSGRQWALEQLAAEGTKSGTIAKFALGRLKRDGRGILYYTAKEVLHGKPIRHADAILFYGPWATPSSGP